MPTSTPTATPTATPAATATAGIAHPGPAARVTEPGLLRVDAHAGPWPLHAQAAARSAEAAALAATPTHSLMQRAGTAVARLALALVPHARRITVLCGPGNNGGDGLVAAVALQATGCELNLWRLAGERSPDDAAWALQTAAEHGLVCHPLADFSAHTDAVLSGQSPPPDLVIDALLGLGTGRAPSGVLRQAVMSANRLAACGVPVLAVDLPTGLDADSGQPASDPVGGDGCANAHEAILATGATAVIRASATLCLLSLKPGCFTGQGRDWAGTVWWDDLGIDARASASAWLSGPPVAVPAPHRAHKGSQGDLVLVGGAAGMAGAAVLAARAALACGAGRVWISPIDHAPAAFDPARPELMHRTAFWQAPPAQLARSTIVCGCGAGPGVAAALPPLLAHAGRLVLDADALNAIAAEPALQAALQARGRRQGATVLTPHPLEAARLLGCGVQQVQASRLDAARGLADQTGAVVVLKGSGTVIASPQGVCRVNPTGNSALASPGTGDVLAGWLGGRWSRQSTLADATNATHATPASRHDALDALAVLAAGAVFEHGAAADRYRAGGCNGPLRAADLIDALVAQR